MKKIMLILLLGIFCISLGSSAIETLGTFEQNTCIDLKQSGVGFTECNITGVSYPNSTKALSGAIMNKNETLYNYTYCSTSALGEYIVDGVCTNVSDSVVWAYDFKVTPSGREATTSESILSFVFVLVLFGLFLLLSYFIIIIPSENIRDERGVVMGIVKLKYLRILLIGIAYPLIIVILNLLNGLAVNFSSLTIFAGTLGFMFETMLRGAWIFTIFLVLWVFYLLVQDSNFKKQMKKIAGYRI